MAVQAEYLPYARLCVPISPLMRIRTCAGLCYTVISWCRAGSSPTARAHAVDPLSSSAEELAAKIKS